MPTRNLRPPLFHHQRDATLPFTGSHTPLLLAVATGLLAAGIGLVALVRPARPTA